MFMEVLGVFPPLNLLGNMKFDKLAASPSFQSAMLLLEDYGLKIQIVTMEIWKGDGDTLPYSFVGVK